MKPRLHYIHINSVFYALFFFVFDFNFKLGNTEIINELFLL